MKRLVLLAALFITGLSGQMALADTSELDKVKLVLKKLMPKAEPDSVKQSAIPGLYEVVMGAHVVYVSTNGRYMMEGDMYDLKDRVNLTENKRQAGRVKAMDGIKKDDMIVFKAAPGKEKHVITAFTDIDCGRCHRSENHDRVCTGKSQIHDYRVYRY